MSTFEGQDVLVSEAVQWWLEKEAANSTFNANSGLDDLDSMRKSLLTANDPKISGHITRMQLWLTQYGECSSPEQTEELMAEVAFGALMFLSGNFRRQRILQSDNQADYFNRKMFWSHPYGVTIPAFLPECLRDDRRVGVSAEAVQQQGKQSIETTQAAFTVIYNNVPQDFGKDISASVEAITHEQENWLTFLSKVLNHASGALKAPLENVPILTPTTIAEAKKTTLSQILSSRKKTIGNI